MINSQLECQRARPAGSISKGMGDQFSAAGDAFAQAVQYIKGDGRSILSSLTSRCHWEAVYQRGWVINSQRPVLTGEVPVSISKGMGDQFSAALAGGTQVEQYIKGDG